MNIFNIFLYFYPPKQSIKLKKMGNNSSLKYSYHKYEPTSCKHDFFHSIAPVLHLISIRIYKQSYWMPLFILTRFFGLWNLLYPYSSCNSSLSLCFPCPQTTLSILCDSQNILFPGWIMRTPVRVQLICTVLKLHTLEAYSANGWEPLLLQWQWGYLWALITVWLLTCIFSTVFGWMGVELLTKQEETGC